MNMRAEYYFKNYYSGAILWKFVTDDYDAVKNLKC